MNKLRFKKSTIKSIITGLLVCALLGGAIFASVSVFGKEKTTKDIPPTFSIGALDENGKYLKSDKSIYTKSGIGCQGLKVAPEFNSTVSYEIFFYGEDGEFLSKTGARTNTFVASEVPFFAETARVVITPNDTKETINIFEISKFANQLEIRVDKKQLSLGDRISSLDNVAVVVGTGTVSTSTKLFTASETPFYMTSAIDVSQVDGLIVKVKTSSLTNTLSFSSMTFDAVFYYDLTGDTAEMIQNIEECPVLYVDGEYSFVMVDVSNITSIILVVDEISSETVCAYLM